MKLLYGIGINGEYWKWKKLIETGRHRVILLSSSQVSGKKTNTVLVYLISIALILLYMHPSYVFLVFFYQVIELLSELENFTWPSMAADDTIVCVSGSQCVSRIDLFPLPGILIRKDSHGLILNPESLSSGRTTPVLISWQIACNSWQVILSCMKLLQHSVSTFNLVVILLYLIV